MVHVARVNVPSIASSSQNSTPIFGGYPWLSNATRDLDSICANDAIEMTQPAKPTTTPHFRTVVMGFVGSFHCMAQACTDVCDCV
jgi:hypothetical protein